MPPIVLYAVSAMLVVGALPLPYGYYRLLRLVATGTFAWGAWLAWRHRHPNLPWLLAFLALLFNPLFGIHLPKTWWTIVDPAAAVVLLWNRRWLLASGDPSHDPDVEA